MCLLGIISVHFFPCRFHVKLYGGQLEKKRQNRKQCHEVITQQYYNKIHTYTGIKLVRFFAIPPLFMPSYIYNADRNVLLAQQKILSHPNEKIIANATIKNNCVCVVCYLFM